MRARCLALTCCPRCLWELTGLFFEGLMLQFSEIIPQSRKTMIIRRILSITALALMVACASPQQQAEIAAFHQWRTTSFSLAQSGAIPWSSYYTGLWERMGRLPSDPMKPHVMAATAEMIPIARRYEAGQMTKEQFDDARRLATSRLQQLQQSVTQQQQMINDAQADRLTRMGQELLKPTNPTTTCLTNRIGPGTLSTTCN